MDMIFNHFEILADLDTSNRDYDNESCTMLLWNTVLGGLFRLDASGCTCCGNMYDDIKVENAVLVSDLEATAREVYEAVVNSDEPDVPALRAGLVLAMERLGVTRDLPALEG
jgi:hypothetical protein